MTHVLISLIITAAIFVVAYLLYRDEDPLPNGLCSCPKRRDNMLTFTINEIYYDTYEVTTLDKHEEVVDVKILHDFKSIGAYVVYMLNKADTHPEGGGL